MCLITYDKKIIDKYEDRDSYFVVDKSENNNSEVVDITEDNNSLEREGIDVYDKTKYLRGQSTASRICKRAEESHRILKRRNSDKERNYIFAYHKN